VFYDLRKNLNLTAMIGSPELVGLHTLLDGAQIEYRAMILNFIDYLNDLAQNVIDDDSYEDDMDADDNDGDINMDDDDDDANSYERFYPELFQKYIFRELDWQSLVDQQIIEAIQDECVPPDQVRHSLANLGLTSGTKYIVKAVAELFNVLNSHDLLNNFQAIVSLSSQELQGDLAKSATRKPLVKIGRVLSKKFRAFTNHFWLNVIGRGNVDQLRYYLRNLLAFDVIPRIIGQVLESRKHNVKAFAKALELAEQFNPLVKQRGEVEGGEQAIEDYGGNTPNYFEFIMLYVTLRELEGFQALLPDAQKKGGVVVDFWYKCYSTLGQNDSLSVWGDIFDLKRSNDYNWSLQNQADCKPLLAKYQRSFFSIDSYLVSAFFLDGEDTSDFFVLDQDDTIVDSLDPAEE
ncbi:hypothetical protein H4R35_003398, partial [Dimargaris xerosporica]